MTREDRDDQLDEGLALIREEADERAERAVHHKFWHHYWPRYIVPLVALVALLVSVAVVWTTSGLYDRQAGTDAALAVVRDQAKDAKTAGDQANAQLQARGQAAVPIPQPGQAPDIDVVVSAATARVLASLPNQRPTAAELGEAVARWFAANPINPPGPTPLQVAAALAGYLATNPPPAGPKGEQGAQGQPGHDGAKGDQGDPGKDGHTPTTEEIQQAFADYLRDHPDALCPKGGTFAQLSVVTQDGGSADVYTCVVKTYPSPTPSALPIPLK